MTWIVRDRGICESYFDSRQEAEVWAVKTFGYALEDVTAPVESSDPEWQISGPTVAELQQALLEADDIERRLVKALKREHHDRLKQFTSADYDHINPVSHPDCFVCCLLKEVQDAH